MSPSHTPSAYLTSALRSHLIRAALNTSQAADILFLLEELGLPIPTSSERESLAIHLQSCLAQLAREGKRLQLIRCCEGLAQFCLWQGESAAQTLEQINQFLPPGLRFSLKSGRLLLDEAVFYAPDNPFLQESQQQIFSDSEQQIAPKPQVALSQESTALAEEPNAAPPMPGTESEHHRQSLRQRIVSQRMQMLKHQLIGK